MNISDLGLASALSCKGYRIIEIVPVPGDNRRKDFVFSDNEELESDIQLYWSHELSVDSRNMFETMKSLKSQLYSQYPTSFKKVSE